MPQSLKISVILPTYNRAEILSRCLDGFCRQTVSTNSFEIVVIDDGSNPPERWVMEKFRGRLNITYHYQENAGLAAARNAAVKRAQAPLLALHDDVDVPASDYLEKCISFHASRPHEHDILLCRVTAHSELPNTPLLEWIFSDEAEIFGFPSPGDHNYLKFYGATSSCKKSLFNRGLYDTAYTCGFEDIEFATRINQALHLRVHYDPSIVSHLIRSPEFTELFRRSYCDGRSHRRYFEQYGEPALEATGRQVLQSAQTVAAIEPILPQLLSIVARLEELGTSVPPEFELKLNDRILRGSDGLYACFKLAVAYSRSKGWDDLEKKIDHKPGIEALNLLLKNHYTASTVSEDITDEPGDPVVESKPVQRELPKSLRTSEPRVDIVLNPGHHPWNVHMGWASTLKRCGVLGQVFQPAAHNSGELFQYLKNPQSDIMVLGGFDQSLHYLHDTDQKRGLWRESPVFKVLLAQETVIQGCYPDNEQKAVSALSCCDLAVYNCGSDQQFFEKSATPGYWQSFGVDESIFSSRAPFDERLHRAYFRGKTTPLGVAHTYQRRRELLKILLEWGLVDYLEFQYSNVVEDLVREFNRYQISMNLPAVFAGFNTRVFESMACGCVLVSPHPGHPFEVNMFSDNQDLLFYDPSNSDELVYKLSWALNNTDQMRRIAANGMNLVREQHTLTKRWEQIKKWCDSLATGSARPAITAQLPTRETASQGTFEGQPVSPTAAPRETRIYEIDEETDPTAEGGRQRASALDLLR